MHHQIYGFGRGSAEWREEDDPLEVDEECELDEGRGISTTHSFAYRSSEYLTFWLDVMKKRKQCEAAELEATRCDNCERIHEHDGVCDRCEHGCYINWFGQCEWCEDNPESEDENEG
jgi:hypothetical protein